MTMTDELGPDQGMAAAPLPPFRRMRRLRRTEAIRRLVRETRLVPGDFIYPLFRDARRRCAP